MPITSLNMYLPKPSVFGLYKKTFEIGYKKVIRGKVSSLQPTSSFDVGEQHNEIRGLTFVVMLFQAQHISSCLSLAKIHSHGW